MEANVEKSFKKISALIVSRDTIKNRDIVRAVFVLTFDEIDEIISKLFDLKANAEQGFYSNASEWAGSTLEENLCLRDVPNSMAEFYDKEIASSHFGDFETRIDLVIATIKNFAFGCTKK